MPTKQGYSHILFDPMRIQIESIGRYMESIFEPIPYPGVRLKDNEFNVSTIVEVSTIKLARERERVTSDQWKRYLDIYLQARKVDPEERKRSGKRRIGERLITISEATLDSIETIGKYLKDNTLVVDEYLFPAPKRLLNNKLVIAFALQCTYEFTEQQ